MNDSKVFEEVRNSLIRVQQFEINLGFESFLFNQANRHARKHSQKGAVHGDTLRQINHEMLEPTLSQFLDGSFEIDTGSEIRPARNANESRMINDGKRNR
jgi:hypothetical protein